MNHVVLLAALMTPDLLTAALTGTALVLSAIGGLLAAVISALSMRRNGKIKSVVDDIQTATNGAKAHAEAVKVALEEKVEGLEQRLVDALADKVAAALLARQTARVAEQAASDVRAERAGLASPATSEDGQ